jgi:hypothetical protein
VIGRGRGALPPEARERFNENHNWKTEEAINIAPDLRNGKIRSVSKGLFLAHIS